MTEASVPLAGVVGWPIAHSRSPRLHAHWLARHGIAGYYIPIGLRAQLFEDGIRALPKLGFRGINITVPYKEVILSMADSVTDRASLIGAANTILFRPDGSIRADNTDGYGFIENIRQTAPFWSAQSGPALVLGAGGAARAVISALLAEGAPEVRVANRTRTRAEMLRDHFGARVVVVDWNRAADAMDGAMTIVNATALGMTGQPDLGISFDAAPRQGALATDLVYTPLMTPFLHQAQAAGLTVVDGLGMLIHQAVPGFESWFGVRPEVDDAVRQVLLAG